MITLHAVAFLDVAGDRLQAVFQGMAKNAEPGVRPAINLARLPHSPDKPSRRRPANLCVREEGPVHDCHTNRER